MRHITIRHATTVAFVILALLATILTADARETRAVGDRWSVEIGFIEEPAIQADTNGLWLHVTENAQPVEGLEQTLQAEVIFGEAVRGLPLIPTPDDPGTYTSTFIPVQPGAYTFRIFGAIGEQAIDETFTSAPEGVAPVDPRIDYEFPSAAQGFVLTELAMPMTIALAAIGYGVLRWTSRRPAN